MYCICICVFTASYLPGNWVAMSAPQNGAAPTINPCFPPHHGCTNLFVLTVSSICYDITLNIQPPCFPLCHYFASIICISGLNKSVFLSVDIVFVLVTHCIAKQAECHHRSPITDFWRKLQFVSWEYPEDHIIHNKSRKSSFNQKCNTGVESHISQRKFCCPKYPYQ